MHERRRSGTKQQSSGGEASELGWPGKRTLTSSLPVQRRDAGTSGDAPAGHVDPAAVQTTASAGVAGAGGALPYRDILQRAFGRHDVSAIKAHVGGDAAQAARSIGATAYATGDAVAFAGTPDLHTTAHEAAHVVQQRGGVSPKGGVGQAGDSHEVQADSVADAVVAGRSAETLLDGMAGGAGGGAAVQRIEDTAQATAARATPTTAAPAAPTTVAAAPVAGAPPEVVALIGTTLVGDGSFEYLVLPDATFRVVGTPPAAAKAMDRLFRPDNEWAAQWQQVCDQIVAQAQKPPPAVAPTPTSPTSPTAPTAPTAPAAPGRGTMILDGLAVVASSLLSPLADAGAAAGDFLSDLIFGEEEEEEAPADQAPAAPRAAPQAAEDKRQALLDGGTHDNLETAQDLKKTIDLHYKKEAIPREGETATDAALRIKNALIGGNPANLDTLNCGQLTSLTLAEAGWDLNTEYVDSQGTPVAYLDNGLLTFVTAFMLVNTQREATAAILDVQAGGAMRIKAGSPEALAYKLSRYNGKVELQDGTTPPATVAPAARTTDFWVSSKTTFVGMDANADQDFGAGSVAALFGGIDVALTDRKPGDLQQRLATTADGTFNGDGHSSQINTVQGTGVCKLVPGGDATCPKPIGASDGLAAGWYEGTWELGPDTEPALVSKLSVAKVALLDANYETDGRKQAIDVGKMKDATTFEASKASQVESSGRLPTSKWIAWAGDFPEAASPGKLS